MGMSYRIKCAKCNYSKDITLGIGFMYQPVFLLKHSDYDNQPLLYGLINNNKILDDVKNILEQQNVEITDYAHSMFLCNNCCEIHNLFDFKLKWDDKSYYPMYLCENCNKQLERVYDKTCIHDDYIQVILLSKDGIKKQWNCPKCNCSSIIMDDIMSILKWD